MQRIEDFVHSLFGHLVGSRKDFYFHVLIPCGPVDFRYAKKDTMCLGGFPHAPWLQVAATYARHNVVLRPVVDGSEGFGFPGSRRTVCEALRSIRMEARCAWR